MRIAERKSSLFWYQNIKNPNNEKKKISKLVTTHRKKGTKTEGEESPPPVSTLFF